jgi:hypothetical protein
VGLTVGGGETAMATAINAMRTVTARSPAWTRGGKKRGVLSLAWPFEAEAGEAGEGWGSVGTTRLVEGKTGKREGAPGVAGAAQAAGISPPAGGCEQRCCKATVEGGGARLTQCERLRGEASDSGARGPAAVCERERRKRGCGGIRR